VADDGKRTKCTTRCRVDNDTEIGYLHHGGILPLVLRELIGRS
jgi:aconitase A